MQKLILSRKWRPKFENSLSVWVPERWAQDALMELEPQMGAAYLVNRDWSKEVASYGDTVNVIRPGTFVAKRKADRDSVSIQNASGTKIPVVLNQHLHVSFLIKDGEESKGMPSLRKIYLQPAMQAMAQGMDEIVLGQGYQFMSNVVGKIGTTPNRLTLIQAREKMNTTLAPQMGRNLFVSPSVEGSFLNLDDFAHVDKAGDTLALKEGSLGRKFGFNIHMGQNVPSITTPGGTVATTVNNSGGYAAGTTSLTLATGPTVAQSLGGWCTIAGDMVPQRITAFNASTGATTIAPGLATAVAHGAAVTIYTVGAINQDTTLDGLVINGYPSGWVREMIVDGFSSGIPTNRRMVTFGTAGTAARYALIGNNVSDTIVTDRPIEGAVATNDIVGPGPIGEYCFGFCRDAMTLAMRPLALPDPNTGVRGAIADYKGFGVRVVITYDGEKQGHLVTVDMLVGIKVMDLRQGCVLLA